MLEGLDSATPSVGPRVPLGLRPVSTVTPCPHQVAHDPCTGLTYLFGQRLGLSSLSRAGRLTELLAPTVLSDMGVRFTGGIAPDGKGGLYLAGDWWPAKEAAGFDPPPQTALVRVFLPGVAARVTASAALQALLPRQAGPVAGLALHYPTDTLYLAAEAGVYEWVENAAGGPAFRMVVQGERTPWLRDEEGEAAGGAAAVPEVGVNVQVLIGDANAAAPVPLAAAGAAAPAPAAVAAAGGARGGAGAPTPLHAIRGIAVEAGGDLLVVHEDIAAPNPDPDDRYIDGNPRDTGRLVRVRLLPPPGGSHSSSSSSGCRGVSIAPLAEIKSWADLQESRGWRPQLRILPHGWLAVTEPHADCRQVRLLKVGEGVRPCRPLTPDCLTSPASGAARRAALVADMAALLPPGCGAASPASASASAAAAAAMPAGGAGASVSGAGDGVWSPQPDVVVRVGGQDFPLHRAVLAARSPFFAEVFGAVGSVEFGGVVPLAEPFTAPAFAHVVSYMYTGGAEDWDDETSKAVADAANFLDLPELSLAAQRHLLERVRPVTFAAALRWAAGWPLTVSRAAAAAAGGGEGGGAAFNLAEELCGWYAVHQQEVLEQAPQSLAELAQGDGGQLALQLLQAAAGASTAAGRRLAGSRRRRSEA
ncbi:hypothetical protein HXX76_001903 [Chlamydomonas incerta]|uniref:BTB domain-containing protein n=1 Tax=Chlamydomonas incerta TaxID=51695 RepID=A0A835WA16_CHLIN|nr:hypothetical protein HXX76_001903 [Chlamydomonas incerta]|eukprot:KAG2443551.1 hypothetical protein HXX76_001903 [Chlamydomonas incerta]